MRLQQSGTQGTQHTDNRRNIPNASKQRNILRVDVVPRSMPYVHVHTTVHMSIPTIYAAHSRRRQRLRNVCLNRFGPTVEDHPCANVCFFFCVSNAKCVRVPKTRNHMGFQFSQNSCVRLAISKASREQRAQIQFQPIKVQHINTQHPLTQIFLREDWISVKDVRRDSET